MRMLDTSITDEILSYQVESFRHLIAQYQLDYWHAGLEEKEKISIHLSMVFYRTGLSSQQSTGSTTVLFEFENLDCWKLMCFKMALQEVAHAYRVVGDLSLRETDFNNWFKQ